MKTIHQSYRQFLGLLMLISLPVFLSAQNLKTVSDLTFTAGNGNKVSLSKLTDNSKVAVIIVTSSHCSWAGKYESRLSSLYQKYNKRGVTFLAVNSNDASVSTSDALARISAQSPFPFPYVKDEDQGAAKALGATKNPEAFVLTKKRSESGQTKFDLIYMGKVDDNPLDATMAKEKYLDLAIASALKGEAPTTQKTAANGCNIKWKH
ncbi:MAG: redoxin domain-containing protein [Bacteroidota bacterium]